MLIIASINLKNNQNKNKSTKFNQINKKTQPLINSIAGTTVGFSNFTQNLEISKVFSFTVQLAIFLKLFSISKFHA